MHIVGVNMKFGGTGNHFFFLDSLAAFLESLMAFYYDWKYYHLSPEMSPHRLVLGIVVVDILQSRNGPV